MDKLTSISERDIENGVLQQMLSKAGIDNVQAYVKDFHQQTEQLVVEDFENSDPNTLSNDEQIVPPADFKQWMLGLRPRFDKAHEPTPNKEKPQEKQPPPPTDLKSWMQRMVTPTANSSPDSTTAEEISSSNQDAPVSGNLSSWLNDWSKNIAEQPPPTSMDNWLKGLIPNDLHETIGKANSPKGRLNSYLNAAEKVLAENGYETSTGIAPTPALKNKVGLFGNVKNMYFLWKTLDKNGDRKITVEDVQIMLQEMGLGFLSKNLAIAVFAMVDSNHDGELEFRDFVALMSILKQLVGAVSSVKTTA